LSQIQHCWRGVSIEWTNQVCNTDITYIPMHGGFLYLVAVMDWYSVRFRQLTG
jgi:hypothetical protein